MDKSVGNYFIDVYNELGRGKCGTVHRGRHTSGEVFAVKIIPKKNVQNENVAALETEIQIMKRLVHRNILKLEDHILTKNNVYLFVEFLSGGDLMAFIESMKNLRNFTEMEALNFLTQITEGIAFLHEKGFVHRDLKPANILLTEKSISAKLKIADFGTSRYLKEGDLATTYSGSPLYMVSQFQHLLFHCNIR
jgi:serine/threonine protein kinase